MRKSLRVLALATLTLLVAAGCKDPDETEYQVLVEFEPGSSPGRVVGNGIDCTPAGGTCSAWMQGGVRGLRLEPAPGGTVDNVDDCFLHVPDGTAEFCSILLESNTSRQIVVRFGFTRPNSPPVANFWISPSLPVEGQAVTFDARASTDDYEVTAYAWSFDNGQPGATGAVLSRTFPAGAYLAQLTVTDLEGETDDFFLPFVVLPGPTNPPVGLPVISQQPQNVTVDLGMTASFTVAVTSGAPLMYRWQRNGVDITGAPDSPIYTTPPVSASDDGAAYRVVISNSAGSTTSVAAILSVGQGWRPVGGAIGGTGPQGPRMAVDSAGTPYVAYSQFVATRSSLFVRKLQGTDWINVGSNASDPVDAGAINSVGDRALIMGRDDLPVVAWIEGARVRVARWTGTAWDFVGDDISIDTADTMPISGIQLSRQGDDLVASWIETVFTNPSSTVNLAVKRYDASTGSWTGGYVPVVGNPSQLRMTLDGAGRALIAYAPRSLAGNDLAIRVVRETATGWDDMGDVGPVPPFINSTARVYGFDLRMDAADVPVVIGSVDGRELFAWRRGASAWLPMGGAGGVFASFDPATQGLAAMAFVRNDPRLVMAHTRQERPATGLARYVTEFLEWNGSAWLPLADPATVTDLTVDMSPVIANGQPMFAAEYRVTRIVVQRFVP